MDEYRVLTGSEHMQPERIHRWLSSHSYWAKDIPFQTVHTAIQHSICVGAFFEGAQVGFARMVTDYAVFAHIADVYVEEPHRGNALGKRMMQALMEQPFIKDLRVMMLGTLDAHGLYRQFGFVEHPHPERVMCILQKDLYQLKKSQNELS